MKRVISLLLVFVMMAMLCTQALAVREPLDLSAVRNSDYLTLDVNKDSNAAFIESSLSTADRSFNHKYENDYLYSSTKFDILIVDYFGDSYPVFRLWINYTADKFQYITAVTFIIDGVRYTFSGISDTDHLYELENGVSEDLLIKFGTDNIGFITALGEYILPAVEGKKEYSDIDITMILHGIEDISVDLDMGFILDFILLMNAFSEIGGIPYLDEAYATTMKIK